MNRFENRLPKTTSFFNKDGAFYVKHTSFNITLDEAHAIVELLKYALEDKTSSSIIIDNYQAKGAWSQDVLHVLEESAEAIRKGDKKFVTLTNSIVAAMQINRIARKHGLANKSKAFYSEFNDDVKSFLKSA